MRLLKAWTVVAVAAALGSAACAVPPKRLYKGPVLPPSEEVTLTTEGSHDAISAGPRLFLEYLDGASLYDVAARITINKYPYPQSVYVKPGPHRVKALLVTEKKHTSATLQFDGAPGRTYVVRATPAAADAEARIWIEDAETGQRVDKADKPEEPAK